MGCPGDGGEDARGRRWVLFLSTVDIISLIWESVSVSLSSLGNGAVDDRFGRFGLLNRLDTRTSGKRRSISDYSTLY